MDGMGYIFQVAEDLGRLGWLIEAVKGVGGWHAPPQVSPEAPFWMV